MDIFKKGRLSAAEQRLKEEALYQEALREIESGVRRDGIWAKAVADSKGEEPLARSLYLKYRVQSMLDEYLIFTDREKKEGKPPAQDELETTPNPNETWKCKKCGEVHELQFDTCWNCGSARTE
jgi:hypothetical protein